MSPLSHFNFARRPFRDHRPVYLAAGTAFLVGAVFFVLNLNLYADFRKDMEGTRRQIEWLEGRHDRAAATAQEARAALDRYRLSSLAEESRGLLRLVEERRFSWTGLLARLERTLPQDVRLARLSPHVTETGEAMLDLALVGRSPDTVVRTVAALSRNPVFQAVELKSETSPEEGVPEGYTFALSMKYRPPEAR